MVLEDASLEWTTKSRACQSADLTFHCFSWCWIQKLWFFAISSGVATPSSRRACGNEPVVPTLSFLHNFLGIIVKDD
jgi:hypothetical protein